MRKLPLAIGILAVLAAGVVSFGASSLAPAYVSRIILEVSATAPTAASGTSVAYVGSDGQLRVTDGTTDAGIGPKSGAHISSADAHAGTATTDGSPALFDVPSTEVELRDFTQNGASRITYTGAQPRMFLIFASFSFTAGGVTTARFWLARGGAVVGHTKKQTKLNNANDEKQMSLIGHLRLEQNEYIEVYVDSSTNETVTCAELQIIAMQVE